MHVARCSTVLVEEYPERYRSSYTSGSVLLSPYHRDDYEYERA